MSQTSRNYHAHGGNEWVVGGKLTFLPGAIVEGAEGLMDFPTYSSAQLPYTPPSEATTVAALREDFNRFIAAMKTAGLMASAAQPEPDHAASNPDGPAGTAGTAETADPTET